MGKGKRVSLPATLYSMKDGRRRRWAVWVFLAAFLAAGNVIAAVTSPGGVTVIPQDFADKDKDRRLPTEAREEVTEQVTREHWTYIEVAALQEKYGSERKLPEGAAISKEELVECFIATLRKLVDKYEKEGDQAISRDDVESIRTLIAVLDKELYRKEAYRTLRRSIEQLLVMVEPPGLPFYKYKYGVNGVMRGEAARNFSFTDLSYTQNRDAGRILYRVKPYAYWRPNNFLDIQLEGQGYGFTGPESSDSHDLTLYQGFVEGKIPNALLPGTNWVALKAGRQEFTYGTAFVLGSDTFFNGLSFDAARLRLQPRWNVIVDLLAGRYVTGISDGIKGNLMGAYLNYMPAEDSTLEGYVFRDTGSEARRSGERLDMVGYRSTSTVGIFAVEHEAVYETGRLFNPATGANEKVTAFGGHVDLTGQFKLGKYDSAVFASFAIGSGDKDAAGGISSRKEFRNPNNDSSLVGDMSVVGDLSGIDVGEEHASGIQAYTLGWGIDIPVGAISRRKLNFTATGRKFVAGAVRDGFSRDIGIETDLTLTYTINKDFSLIVGYDRFFTGKFFREASGSNKDMDYVFALLTFNLDRTKRTMRIGY